MKTYEHETLESDLLEALADNAGISTVLDIAARYFGNPCCLLDLTFQQCVGHSQKVPTTDELWNAVAYGDRRFADSIGPDTLYGLDKSGTQDFARGLSQATIVDASPYLRRLVASFDRAGVLYQLCVLENDRPFHNEDLLLARPCTLALSLLLRRQFQGSDKQRLSAFLNGAIRGAMTETRILAEARDLGIGALGRMRLLLLRDPTPETGYHNLVTSRFAIARELGCEHSTTYDGSGVFLLRDSPNLREAVEDALQGTPGTWRAGLSFPFEDALHIGTAYQEAGEALGACERPGEAVPFEDAWVCSTLNGIEATGAPIDLIRHIATSDMSSGSSYLETLREYLACLGDQVAAAANLHVHENTMRYRLRRLQELFDIDLSDRTTIRNLTFALWVLEASGEAGGHRS